MNSPDYLSLAVGIIILGIVVSVGAVIFINYQTAIVTTNSSSFSENIFSDNATATSLTDVPNTNSLTATRKNLTWLSLDGVGDYLTINSSSYNNFTSTGFTISMWLNNSDVGANISETIISQNDNDTNRVWSLYQYEGKLRMYGNTNGTNGTGEINETSVLGVSEINDSIWHHIVGVWNTTSLAIYFDGFYNGTVDLDAIYSSDIAITVGKEAAYSNFTGGIDDIRIYNRTLSSAEIGQINVSGRGANHSLTSGDLILWMPLNENTGTTTYNSHNDTGGMSNGTITGATWTDDEIEVTLTEDTDYTLSETTFTIIDLNEAWTQIQANYTVTSDNINAQDYTIANDAETALGEFGNWFKIIVIVGIAGLILFLVLSSFSRPDKTGGSY